MAEEKKERFKRIDNAIEKIRTEVDDIAEGGKSARGKATKEVREALDALDNKVDKLRKRE